MGWGAGEGQVEVPSAQDGKLVGREQSLKRVERGDLGTGCFKKSGRAENKVTRFVHKRVLG